MYRISVDVGGTFTDVVVSDDDGRLHIGKALTSPDRAFEGIRAGLESLEAELGASAAGVLAAATELRYGTSCARTPSIARTTLASSSGRYTVPSASTRSVSS